MTATKPTNTQPIHHMQIVHLRGKTKIIIIRERKQREDTRYLLYGTVLPVVLLNGA